MTIQPRVSRMSQNLPNGGNSIETIYSGCYSKKTPNTRFSLRLQKIPLDKRPDYRCTRQKRPPLNSSQDKSAVKKLKVDHSASKSVSDPYEMDKSSLTVENENDEKDAVSLQETGSKQSNCDDTLAAAVKNKLRLFNKYYLHFVKVNFLLRDALFLFKSNALFFHNYNYCILCV